MVWLYNTLMLKRKDRVLGHLAAAAVVVATGAAVYSYDHSAQQTAINGTPAPAASFNAGGLVAAATTQSPSPQASSGPTIDTSKTGGVVTIGTPGPSQSPQAATPSNATPKASPFSGLSSNPLFLIICGIVGFGVVWIFVVSREWLTELSAGHSKMRTMRMVVAIALLAFGGCLAWLFIQAYLFRT